MRRLMRVLVRLSIAVSIGCLVLYAVAVTLPWHRLGVTPADCIAPAVSVVCGLGYLRRTGRRS